MCVVFGGQEGTIALYCSQTRLMSQAVLHHRNNKGFFFLGVVLFIQKPIFWTIAHTECKGTREYAPEKLGSVHSRRECRSDCIVTHVKNRRSALSWIEL